MCYHSSSHLTDFEGLLQPGDTGVVLLLQLPLHPDPAIIYWVEVRRIARPIDEGYVGSLLEPLGHNLGLVQLFN